MLLALTLFEFAQKPGSLRFLEHLFAMLASDLFHFE
jgi:hypothetical protein